jgi:hypothetical protein
MPRMKSLITFLIVLILAGCGGEPAARPEETPQAQPAAAPQKAPDEPAALAAIAEVNAAQKNYMARNRRYALSYEELMEALLLKEEPTVQTTGYEIKLRPAADAASYSVLAVPSASSAGRHFFSDQTGIIRTEDGKDANAQSPAISQ